MSVYQKFLEVQKTVRALAPNEEGPKEKGGYKYVSGAKALSIIRPKMDEVGLLCLPEIVGIRNTPMTYSTKYGTKTEIFTELDLLFTWVDTEDGSSFTARFAANGMNDWDKGLGSALTYGERYYLLKAFHIATDKDDIDSLQREEAIGMCEPTKQTQPQQRVKKPMSNTQFLKACQRIEQGDPIIKQVEDTYILTPEQQEIINNYK